MFNSFAKHCGMAAIAVLSVGLSLSASADSGWGFSVYANNLSIESTAAKREGVGDSATTLGLAAERYSSENNRILNLGIEIVPYNDRARFSQTTKSSPTGEINDSTSSADAVLLFVDYGPRFKFGQDQTNHVTVRGGISAMVSSERGIDNCTNCASEKIDIEGGFYGLVGVGHSFGGFTLGLQLQQYITGDLGTGVGIKLSSSF